MRTLPVAIVFLFAAGQSALARVSASIEHPQCYENVGCPHKDRISDAQTKDMSCQNLSYVRNTIFHQRGYCFQTARELADFDNKNCTTKSVSDLKLTSVEKSNVATLQRAERRKKCK